LLWEVADALAFLAGKFAGRPVEDRDAAPAGLVEAQQEPDRRRLTGAAGADDTDDLAPRNIEVERVDGVDRAERFPDAGRADEFLDVFPALRPGQNRLRL
jgi:hypothetical protein